MSDVKSSGKPGGEERITAGHNQAPATLINTLIRFIRKMLHRCGSNLDEYRVDKGSYTIVMRRCRKCGLRRESIEEQNA
jgi:hypothetical protein